MPGRTSLQLRRYAWDVYRAAGRDGGSAVSNALDDLVFTMSGRTFGGKPTAFFDLFRVSHSKIAEHWDIVADIPTMAHKNGKF